MDDNYDIFISFRTEGGLEFAEKLAKAINVDGLLGAGVTAFYSNTDGAIRVGAAFPDQLRAAVMDCSVFVSVLSPDSLHLPAAGHEDFVYEEIRNAIDYRKKLFVIAFDDFHSDPQFETDRYLGSLLRTQAVPFGKASSFEQVCERLHDFHRQMLTDSRTRANYERLLSSEDYLDWEQGIMRSLYQTDAEAAGGRLTDLCGFTYDTAVIPYPESGRATQFPFLGLCDNPLDLNLYGAGDDRLRPENLLQQTREARRALYSTTGEDPERDYLRIVSDSMLYPERFGYMMDAIDLIDQEGTKGLIQAHCGTYFQNIQQSHSLQHELVAARDSLASNASIGEILETLPRRRAIHQACSDLGGPLVSGRGRDANLSVQLMIVAPNPKGVLCTLLIQRSSMVATKPGFYQLIPSGGFEAHGDLYGDLYLETGYDVVLALYRELLEECFGVEEDAFGHDPYAVYRDAKIKGLTRLLASHEAKFSFLGVATGLVALRPELSFLLYVPSMEFAESLIPNYENRGIVQMLPLGNLIDKGYWDQQVINPASGALVPRGKLLNTTTAGLIALAVDSPMFRDLVTRTVV